MNQLEQLNEKHLKRIRDKARAQVPKKKDEGMFGAIMDVAKNAMEVDGLLTEEMTKPYFDELNSDTFAVFTDSEREEAAQAFADASADIVRKAILGKLE